MSLIETLRNENSKQEQEIKQLREMLAIKDREPHNVQVAYSEMVGITKRDKVLTSRNKNHQKVLTKSYGVSFRTQNNS